MADGPRINDKFPIREALSPPTIAKPVPECSEAVYVSGFVPHATVKVFANLVELLAQVTPEFGFAEITLNRRVKLGESLSATQTVGAQTSPHSPAVIVSALLESAVKNTKPIVGKDLYQCGIVVPVDKLVPGVRVHVTENAVEIANTPVAATWHPVITNPLNAGGKVSAMQVACEGTGHEIKGPMADIVIVKPAPVPTPTPQPIADSMIPGNDTVTLTGLLVGAGVHIFDHNALVSSGWFATGDANYFPLSAPLTAGSSITADQELCGKVSKPSDPVTPSGRLTAPIVLDPICDGAKTVVIRGTIINATLVVMRNNTIVGYGGAAPGDVILNLGSGITLHTGDKITAIQYVGATVSPTSNTVIVVARLGEPSVEILGGEPFFLAKGNEQPIDGPVFPRGRGPGPLIKLQACCSEQVHIQILDPNEKVIAEPALIEQFPGYFTATWPWTSTSGWSVPDGIPVGKYWVRATSKCSEKPAKVPFYVIFNPADVGGPPRFSFDDTAVWFGASNNGLRGLHYFLHQSDRRVFSIAIGAVSGMTNSFDAAVALARAEEALFAYSLSYHTQDVVDLIVNYTEAQCADDAGCLTALMRAMGIPAHPVTADAGLETGAANWTFDTWVEFLAPHSGKTDWWVLHPHEYPNMQPESRAVFGTRGVANKAFNDLIVMANENWAMGQLDDASNDVSYGRNACGEPNQHLTLAPWIGELCESGYWSQTHWDCTGVSARSLSADAGFRMLEGALIFGGRLAGLVSVTNPVAERRFGRFAVELIAHRVESKGFGEHSLDKVELSVTLDGGQPLTVPFELKLPETLDPGWELYLWARLDRRTAVLQEVRIAPYLKGELAMPETLMIGERAIVRAQVTNTRNAPVRDVMAELRAPFALEVERTRQPIGDIRPYETRELSWAVRAIAPLRSASLFLAVASANGGGLRLRQPFTIAQPHRPPEGRPGFKPEKPRTVPKRKGK